MKLIIVLTHDGSFLVLNTSVNDANVFHMN